MAARHNASQSSASTIAPTAKALSNVPQNSGSKGAAAPLLTPSADNLLAGFAARLNACLAHLAPRCVAFYWPIGDEIDLRDIMARWLADNAEHGVPGIVALPVVSGKDAPMAFHRWHADMPMQEGAFRIAVPAQIEVVTPDLLLVPCVGFDTGCFRLGYGGGFYDRTLAAMSPRPATLGIAFSCTGVDALPVEAHDIPLDGILTEDRALGSVASVF